MTPELRLRLDARKVLLSWMRNLLLPGIFWIIKSTQMMLDPTMQAESNVQVADPTVIWQGDHPLLT